MYKLHDGEVQRSMQFFFFNCVYGKAHRFRLSLHSKVRLAHQAGRYLCFSTMKQSGVFLPPPRIGWLPTALNSQTLIYTPRWERRCESGVSCARIQALPRGKPTNLEPATLS